MLALQWNKYSNSRRSTYTIRKHCDVEYVVGNLVILSIHNFYMHNNCRFAACFIGPFNMLKHIGKLAFHIELPPIYYALHNVFHVSKLKLYILGGGDGTSTN